jgi:hypothetical protein
MYLTGCPLEINLVNLADQAVRIYVLKKNMGLPIFSYQILTKSWLPRIWEFECSDPKDFSLFKKMLYVHPCFQILKFQPTSATPEHTYCIGFKYAELDHQSSVGLEWASYAQSSIGTEVLRVFLLAFHSHPLLLDFDRHPPPPSANGFVM